MKSDSRPWHPASLWPWLLAWSPAVLLLVLAEPLWVPVPFEDSWAYVLQYRDWREGGYSWRELMAPHNNHPSVPGKLVYFVVLRFMGGDVALLPVVTWLLAGVLSLSVFFMSRPWWREHPWHGPMLMGCVNLIVFSAAAGHAWTWDFLFQNCIAGTCFAAGLLILSRHPLAWGRVLGAALLNLVATFSFATGFLGGALLTGMIWSGFKDRPAPTRIFAAATWLILTLGAAWLALKGFGDTVTTGEGSRVGFLLAQPALLVQFVFLLLGFALGNGTSMDPAQLGPLMGAGVMLVFIVATFRLLQKRRNAALVRAALPWVLMALYGLGNAGLITYGRMRHSLIAAMAPRYVVFTLFFTLGTLLLVYVIAVHEPGTGSFGKALRRIGGAVLGLFLAIQAVNWNWGYQQMRRDHVRMHQEAAMLGFTTVLPAEANALWQWPGDKDEVGRLVKFLNDQDELRGVRLAASSRLSELPRRTEVASKWAWFDVPHVRNGVLYVHGACGLSKDLLSLPEAILITAQTSQGEEEIVAVTGSDIPFDFYENEWRRRLHLGHYFGWSHQVPAHLLPAGRVTLRAYAYDAGARSVRILAGVHEVENSPSR